MKKKGNEGKSFITPYLHIFEDLNIDIWISVCIVLFCIVCFLFVIIITNKATVLSITKVM